MTETRLNYPVWRAELDVAMKGHKDAIHPWIKKQYADDITKLHRIRAHIKGKLHRQHARLTWYDQRTLGLISPEEGTVLAENGGSTIVKLHLPDEAKLLGDAWKKYAVEVEVIEKGPEEKPSVFTKIIRYVLG